MTSPSPTRREVLTARLGPEAPHEAPPEAHISSLVVHVRPDAVEAVRAALVTMPGVEIHAAKGGKLVVTLETGSEGEIVSRLTEITFMDGVLSAALVYHHFEPGSVEADGILSAAPGSHHVEPGSGEADGIRSAAPASRHFEPRPEEG